MAGGNAQQLGALLAPAAANPQQPTLGAGQVVKSLEAMSDGERATVIARVRVMLQTQLRELVVPPCWERHYPYLDGLRALADLWDGLPEARDPAAARFAWWDDVSRAQRWELWAKSVKHDAQCKSVLIPAPAPEVP